MSSPAFGNEFVEAGHELTCLYIDLQGQAYYLSLQINFQLRELGMNIASVPKNTFLPVPMITFCIVVGWAWVERPSIPRTTVAKHYLFFLKGQQESCCKVLLEGTEKK